METKICTKCGIEKTIDKFTAHITNGKKYYYKCKNCINEEAKLHKKEKSKYDKNYRRKNKEKIINRQNNWRKNRLKNDIVFNTKENLKNLIYYSFIRKQKYKINSKAYKIFGCDWNFFYKHLLQTFENNYGYKWDGIEPIHIDHIIPLVRAKTIEDVIKLNHYTNLQLLKPEDNLKKGINTNLS